ncbi:MAG: response regulator, partial [Deltaproteobacteria bacterium]|nr:response regulator [Deltaproteobacteria bacterium]
RYDDSISLPQNEKDLAILISVEDTGVGIPPEQLNRIFGAFFQGDVSSTKRYSGTGLGLAISKRLVEIMGGSIWAESRPNVGSTFYFTARFGIGSESDIIADEPAGQHKPLTINPLRILLAEDDLLNQMLETTVLQCQGHTVTVANNGKEVLDLLNREIFDLILMDVSMPEMGGIEATREIRNSLSNNFDKNIKIIAQTAHAVKGDREKLLEAGMDGYISKPIDVDQLIEEIANIAPGFVNRQTSTGRQADKDTRNQSTGIDEGKHPVIDVDALRTRFYGQEDFFVQILSIFFEEFPKRMTAINTAIEVGDFAKLSLLAHSFKGVAATVCALEIAGCADRIYQAALENDLEGAKSQVKELNLALDRVRAISVEDLFSAMPTGSRS